MSPARKKSKGENSSAKIPGTKKPKLPKELTEGLEPTHTFISPWIKLRRGDDHEWNQAIDAANATFTKKLEVLREWYEVPAGPNCWLELCVAMARQRFPGFRHKTGRKPPKWTPMVLQVLAGCMRWARDAQVRSREEAAKQFAMCEPWRSFLARGRWKNKPIDREAWENLLDEYTRMPKDTRTAGEALYLRFAQRASKASFVAWVDFVRSTLDRPT